LLNNHYIVFGPQCFQLYRDRTFNHARSHWEDRLIGYLHSKYINQNGAVVRVDVLGKNLQERVTHYFSFFPKRRYLLHDYFAPLILSAPVKLFFPNHEVRNPFYSHSPDDYWEIYSVLLSRMAESVKTLFLIHTDHNILNLANACNVGNIQTALWNQPRGFPYVMFGHHASAYANDALAHTVHGLIKNSNEKFPFISIYDEYIYEQGKLKKEALNRYQKIVFLIEERETAGLYDVTKRFDAPDRYLSIKKDDMSVLILKNKNGSILDSLFLFLPFALNSDMQFVFASGDKTIALSKLKLLESACPIGILEWHFAQIRLYPRKVVVDVHQLSSQGFSDFFGNGNAVLSVNDAKILTLKRSNQLVCAKPFPAVRMGVVRPYADSYADIKTLDPEGTISMKLVHEESEKSMKLTVAQWIIRTSLQSHD
jgi:hypothetical protein